jgi:glycosyltransferase involved in cell wall biosynthesis
MKVLFLVTELQKQFGGLYRYTVQLLDAWNRIPKGKMEYEPLVLSLRDPNEPLGDLKRSGYFREFERKNRGVRIYEAVRGGQKCYFIDGQVPDMNLFHYELWKKYRVKSEKISKLWPFYKTLCNFWYWAPRVAKHLAARGVEIACIDAQDWLAFPAGFLARENIDRPLVCRFHSGEFGRSVGHPDFDSAPVLVEAAALQEADYVQGVSIRETMFEITNLMPVAEGMMEDLRKDNGEGWYAYQKMKKIKHDEFLIYESEVELVLLRDFVGAIPNGIHIGEWKNVRKADIERVRKALRGYLPGKERFVFFLGRAVYRKGIDFLIEAFGIIKKKHPEVGLVISSSMDENAGRKYSAMIKNMGLGDTVYIMNKWLSDREKKVMFCASDVIALPSVYEPFGIVALEGLAADYVCEKNGLVGPVVVVGGTGGMDEIIRSGMNGLEIPIENFRIDPEILAHAIISSISDGNMKRRISKNGAKRVRSKYFDWNFIANRIFEVYGKAENNFRVYRKFC